MWRRTLLVHTCRGRVIKLRGRDSPVLTMTQHRDYYPQRPSPGPDIPKLDWVRYGLARNCTACGR